VRRDPDLAVTSGAQAIAGATGQLPEMVWLTAESLGDDDPALVAHPDAPAVFVWDLPLLHRLRLSSKRLVFLAQCLADLALRRDIIVRVGDPTEELAGMALAATFAPVPGWHRIGPGLNLTRVYAWPWLVPPHDGPVTSFTAWRRRARA
jgi:deoxyribodipyrimidine photo-lyase